MLKINGLSILSTCLFITVLICTFILSANTLDGKKLQLKAGNFKMVNPILTIQCEGKVPENKILTVIEPKTGRTFPATLRNGELTFIPDGAMPNSEHTYVIKLEDKPAEYTPRVVIEPGTEPNTLQVKIEDKLFTIYHYGSQWKKTFLWPLLSENQYNLTRDYPMNPEGAPKFAQDHPHHKSFWTAYGDLNGVNIWTEEEGTGYQKAESVTYGSGDAYGWIISNNKWFDKDGNYVITENREYRFYATPENARLFDAFVTFLAEEKDVLFKDTKEGGMVSARMNPDISSRGIITIATGETGEENVWGKPSPWCDYSADIPNVGWRGLAIFDHPKNLRYPTSWHVRKYGLFTANCFGYSEFRKKPYNSNLPESGDYTLKKGENLSFRYRMYVHTGDVNKSSVAEYAKTFQESIQLQWINE